jgi:hypothetical protein
MKTEYQWMELKPIKQPKLPEKIPVGEQLTNLNVKIGFFDWI